MSIYVIVKVWFGGRIELLNAYVKEKEARYEASLLMPKLGETFSISLAEITLIGIE